MAIKLDITGNSQGLVDNITKARESMEGITRSYEKMDEASRKAFNGGIDPLKKYNDEVKRTNGLIEDIEDNIKKWEEAVKKATTVEAIEKYNRKIAEAKINLQEYKKAGVDSVEKVNKQFEKGQDIVGKFEKRIISVFAAYKIWGASKELLNTGIELDQLNRKSSIVFGAYKKDVESAAKKTATDIGLTRSEFVGAAADIAGLLAPMKFTRQEATVMATSMVGVSGAISEWNNGKYNAVEVSKMLAKSLMGEGERLKELEIPIDQSTKQFKDLVAAKMKDKGITDEQAKALTMYELIIEKTKDQQDSFRDNTDSLSKSKKTLLVNLKNIKESLSADLIPTWNRLFGFINRNIEPIKTIAKVLVILTLGILPFVLAAKSATAITNLWTGATKILTGALATLKIMETVTLIGALLSVVTTIVSAFVLFRGRTEEITDAQSDYNDELERTQRIKLGIKDIDDRSTIIDKMSKQQLEDYKQRLEEQIRANEETNTKILIAQKKFQEERRKLTLEEDAAPLITNESELKKYDGQDYPARARDIASIELYRLMELEKSTNTERLQELKKAVDGRLNLLRVEADSSIEILELQAESMDEGRKKDELLETIRYRKQQEKFKDNNAALLIIAEIHTNQMDEIAEKYRQKAIQDEQHYQDLKAENIADEQAQELAKLQNWYDKEKLAYEENSREMEELNKQRAKREKDITEKYRKQGIQERLDEFDKGQQTELALYEANLTDMRIAAKDDQEALEVLENDRTIFMLKQQKKRIEYLLQFGEFKNATEKGLYEAFLKQIDAEINEAGSKIPKKSTDNMGFFWQILGFNPDNPKDVVVVGALEEFTNQMIGQIDRLMKAEVEAAEKRRELAQQRVDEAQRSLEIEMELSAQGYASNVSKKRQELAQMKEMRDKALKDEEKARKAQAAMDTIMQSSSLITASASIFKALAPLAPFGIPLAIALIGTMLTTFALTRAKISKLTKLREGRTGIMAGLLKGRSHEEGGEIFEVEGGEYHSITPKDKAKKHLPLLEAIRTDNSEGIFKAALKGFRVEHYNLDRSLPGKIREERDNNRREEMRQVFNMDVSKLDETNRLLKQLTNVPAVDGFSDKDYVKYILPNGDQKWIKKQG